MTNPKPNAILVLWLRVSPTEKSETNVPVEKTTMTSFINSQYNLALLMRSEEVLF